MRGRQRDTFTLQPFWPNDLKNIYGIPPDDTLGHDKVIACVVAYGCSTAEPDLNNFIDTFGLAPVNFIKVNQTGGTTYPPDDLVTDWALEAALDVQSAHAFAPAATIMLVVCNSDDLHDLIIGVEYAKNHADYISMSWGAPEGSWYTQYDSVFTTAGTRASSFFASTGDMGSNTGVEYPASSRGVVAVGGTSLYTNADFSQAVEQGWSGSGGGCSVYTAAIASQLNQPNYWNLGCNGYKAVPDIAMVADHNSGLVIFLSQTGGYGSCDPAYCYWIAGGTSLASPLVAARSAIRRQQVTPTYLYTGGITKKDITVGSNGAYYCATGLNLVTGSGSWIGTS